MRWLRSSERGLSRRRWSSSSATLVADTTLPYVHALVALLFWTTARLHYVPMMHPSWRMCLDCCGHGWGIPYDWMAPFFSFL